MKKILFATTALVATAGVASAEVALSGSAEMGIVGGDAYANNTQFWTDIGVKFKLSGTADNGLTFGASINLEDAGSANGTASISNTDGSDDYTVFIASGPFKLTMGDTDGAFDAAMQEVGIGGSIDDAHTIHAGYSGNSGLDGVGTNATYGGQIATASYSASGFTGYFSVALDDSGFGDPVYGLGAKYATDMSGVALTLGLGYQTTDTNGSAAGGDMSIWGISVGAAFTNGMTAIVNYSDKDNAGVSTTHMGIGLGYSMNALTIGVNYGEFDTAGATTSGFGLAVDYDLGGGLVAQVGYGLSNPAVGADTDQWSMGLAMSF